MSVSISIYESPYQCHTNPLFNYIKRELVDEHIYDIEDRSYPYSSKKAYTFRITGIVEETLVYANGMLVTVLKESPDTQYLSIEPVLGHNDITLTDTTGTILFERFQFNCYHIHYFLSVISYKFKQLYNQYLQATANTYYAKDLVQNLDDIELVPEYSYVKSVAQLLGTTRYTQFDEEEAFEFLHKVFDINKVAGTEKSFQLLSEAFSPYVTNITLHPLRQQWPSYRHSRAKVRIDASNNTKLLIYPSYVFLNYTWQRLPYYNQAPDSTNGTTFKVYCDGEVDVATNSETQDELLIKYDSVLSPNYLTVEVSETFTNSSIYVDTTGEYTGFVGELFVALSNPLLGTDIIDANSSGGLSIYDGIYSSLRYISQFNLVSLGCKDLDNLGDVTITYNTIRTPLVLALVARSTSTGPFVEVLKSGLSNVDATRETFYSELGYLVIGNSSGKVDNELQLIISQMVREILPISCYYFLRFNSYSNFFTNWGQTNITLQEVEDLELTFGDLL